MLRYVLGFRANVAIMFLGAFAVMALIKLTTYLPGKYYFSFSKLYAGASEPFIVDPPSVTGAKLCALMSRHNLSASDIGRSVDCKAKLGASETTHFSGAALFDKSEIDRIYTLALTADKDLRATLVASEPQLIPQRLPDAELDQILAASGSVNEAFRRLWGKYEMRLGEQVEQVLKASASQTFATIRVKETSATPRDQGESGPQLKGLTPEQTAAIRNAHTAFLQALMDEKLGAKARPLTKSAVDGIVNSAYSAQSIANGVARHYRESVVERAKAVLQSKFAGAGVAPVEKEAAKRIIFEELVKDGLSNYIIATLVRLAPVLLVGLALGFIFGRSELFSASFAGALAAFLLTWPIMLMWDRVVQSTWHDKKLIFIAFYLVYIISFFLTARVGALIGVRAREGAPETVRRSIDSQTASVPLKGASWGELAVNIMLGLVANGAVAAWNMVIPLSA